MPEKHEFLNRLRALMRALPLLAVLGLPCAAGAEETGGAFASTTTSLLPQNLFSGDSLFGRLSDRVRFSGFARLVGGYLDDGDANYQGYDNAISFGQHSLFALQTDIKLTETLSFATQLLAHASAAGESGLEWAYLSWRPSRSWRFKAGKLRTPIYLHSDTIDVGFSYPWIIPPQAVYTPYVPNDFTGLSAAYQFNIREWSIETKAYWGRFEGAITELDEDPLGIKVDNLRGLILALNRGNLRLRASYHRAVVDIKAPALARLAGQLRPRFPKSADSLNTKTDVDFMQAGVSYDTLDYFLKAEWTRMSHPPAFGIPTYDSYYLSGGYTFYPFNLPITPHVTFANISVDDAPPPVNEIPAGGSRLVARLRSDYLSAFQSDSIGNDSLQRLSVGLRWDVNPAVALKAEWIHLRADRDKRGFFTFDPAGDFDRKANLFLLGLEWVF